MKISRRKLAEMVAHEVRERLRSLYESDGDPDDDDEEGGEGKPEKPSTKSADGEKPRKGTPPPGPSPDTGSPGTDIDGPAVDSDQPDPDAEEDEQDGVDADGDGGENPSGAVNDEVSGKTVQAVTIEPRSKVLPGAKEVVIAFNESTDTLRILVTATGQVKFFWRGQLHDIP